VECPRAAQHLVRRGGRGSRALASLGRLCSRTRPGRRIACPLLALWSDQGALDTWYAGEGGPIALWRAWSDDARGHALSAGHFFPEEAPEQTADALNRFFGAAVMESSRSTNRKRG
jgi:haloacetate dehalogenase